MPLAVLGGLVGTSRKPASRGAMALLLPSPGISITIIERQNCLQSRLQAGRSFFARVESSLTRRRRISKRTQYQ